MTEQDEFGVRPPSGVMGEQNEDSRHRISLMINLLRYLKGGDTAYAISVGGHGCHQRTESTGRLPVLRVYIIDACPIYG